MARVKSIVKKLALVVGILVVLLLTAAVVIPLVVNVDKYRPEIVRAANQEINGQLDLGKLTLSLWGRVRVEVGGLTLKDSRGHSIVAVKEAFFDMPFSSLLSGTPVLTFKMARPEVNVVKDATGQLNVLTLAKKQPSAPAAPAPTPSPSPLPGAATPAEAKKPLVLPAIALKARLGVELQNALVSYVDEKGGLTTALRDLNVRFKDISLSHPIQYEIWADLDTAMGAGPGPKVTVKGPMRLDGTAEIALTETQSARFSTRFKFDSSDMEIRMPGVFEKKKGVTSTVEAQIHGSEAETKIDELFVKFFNAEVRGSGSLKRIATTTPAPGAPSASASAAPAAAVQFSFKSNDIDLKPWVELLPLLKEYKLTGTANLQGGVTGPSDRIDYQALLAFHRVTAKAPKLKVTPELDLTVDVVTDRIKSFVLTGRAPGNDFKVQGQLTSFTRPTFSLAVTSSGLDLDQLIELPPLKTEKTATVATAAGKNNTAGGPGTAPSAAPTPVANYDEMIAPLAKNPMFAATSGTLSVNIKSLKVYDIKVSDIFGNFSLNDRTVLTENTRAAVWGGRIQAGMALFLASQPPAYKFSLQVSDLDLRQAVASQMAFLKNTVLGKLSLDVHGLGESFNPESAKKNVNLNGTVKVAKATFATIDVSRMVGEAVNQSLTKIAERIPGAKGKQLQLAVARESRYDLISSTFTLSKGRFAAPDFKAKAEPNQGIDLKGNTEFGIIDYSIKASWELVDTYNLTHARDLSLEQSGIKVDHILAEGNNPVRFPVHVGCTLAAPCYSYTEVPEYLAKIAYTNASRAVEGKAKEELRKKAEELTKKAPPAVQDAVKKWGGKIFGR